MARDVPTSAWKTKRHENKPKSYAKMSQQKHTEHVILFGKIPTSSQKIGGVQSSSSHNIGGLYRIAPNKLLSWKFNLRTSNMIKTVSKFSDSAESLKRVEMEGQYPFYKNMSFSIYFMAIFFETSLETAFFFRNINFSYSESCGDPQ